MSNHVLITGATGMIGKALIKKLLDKGHRVSVLSRQLKPIPGVQVYLWDVPKQQMDERALDGVDTIIHLAGASVADEKWTEKRKNEIVDSRVDSTALLYDTLSKHKNQVTAIISASAVGYYGDSGDEILTEETEPGYDFLARCCVEWENAVDKGKSLGLRITKFRTGVVLDNKEGALPTMAKPVKLFVGAALGTGKQWVPWIHLDDMVGMYIKALEDITFMGTYNGCAPYPVTNATLTKALGKVLHRPIWPISVPAKVLDLLLGEMSTIALSSNNTSAQKILNTGFSFKYIRLSEALSDIYRS
ncbi:MAG: TIGR01777 family protein [Pedobacter sp.]|nr:MAG: TIGR01777 family protein [Pedobacter sp.]